jgi:hypothetical protein
MHKYIFLHTVGKLMLIEGEKIVNASADTSAVQQRTGSVTSVRCIKEIEKCTVFVS